MNESVLTDRRLPEIAARAGEAILCEGNRPLDLGQPGYFWYVEHGSVNVFLVETSDEEVQTAYEFMVNAEAGRMLFFVSQFEQINAFNFVAKGAPGTIVRQIPVSHIDEIPSEELVSQVDEWLGDVSDAITREIKPRPRTDAIAQVGKSIQGVEGQIFARGGVVWVSPSSADACLYLSMIEPFESGLDGVLCFLLIQL